MRYLRREHRLKLQFPTGVFRNSLHDIFEQHIAPFELNYPLSYFVFPVVLLSNEYLVIALIKIIRQQGFCTSFILFKLLLQINNIVIML